MVEIPKNDVSIRNKVAHQKIDSKQNVKVLSEQAKTANQMSRNPDTSEQIALSSKAKSIHQAQEVLKTTPEIRTEKVNRIKKEIAEGRFNIDSEVLAEKILEDIIREKTFLK